MDTLSSLFRRCLPCLSEHLPSRPTSPLPAPSILPSPLPAPPIPSPPIPASSLPAPSMPASSRPASPLPVSQRPPVYPPVRYIFIDTVDEANHHLKTIVDGAIIGLDTEAMELPNHQKLSKQQKKAKLRDEIRNVDNFIIDWNNLDVCVAQIATVGDAVYVIHIRQMRGLPVEFVRICQSPLILKVSAGIFSDGQRLWDSFRLNLMSVASLGLAARLAYPEKILPNLPYGNEPALAIVVQCVLGFDLPKVLQNSAWGSIPLSEAQKQYAAIDAHASLASYRVIQSMLERCGYVVEKEWYSYDIIHRTRRKKENRGDWRPECPWWSAEGIYTGRT